MRLSVHHTTRYRFSEPQARIVQALRLFPSDSAHQTLIDWRIDVDRDAHLREGQDGYGNRLRMLYAEGPIETLEITVSGEVLLSDADLVDASDPFPPELYQRATPLTEADDRVRALAGDVVGTADGMTALAARIRREFSVDRRPPPGIRSAIDTAAGDRGSARDLAQLFVAAARSTGIPARYVSGYGLAADEAGQTAAPHAWAEVWIAERDGWMAFDPSIDGRPQTDRVRVAVALDAAGAAPVAGTRIGHGEEALDVDVHVADVGA